MRFIYTFILYCLTPIVLLRLYLLGMKNPEYRKRWQERFGFVSWDESDNDVIWLHAVSVGEVNAAVPLVNRLLEEYSDHQILLTTVTPTGAFTVNQHFNGDVHHRYLPYDLPFSVKRFLKCVRPKVLITMETEIWPNLYFNCERHNIPISIINARLSQKSAKGYQLVSSLMRETLGKVDLIAAQTKSDADRFISFGADREKVKVSGNLKFDVVVSASVVEQAQALKRYFSVNRLIWIAASTHEGEEEIILAAHHRILEKYSDAILILAPRHPERASNIASLCKQQQFKYVKRTEQAAFPSDASVYLLDTLGELQLHYATAEIAFVGGSLIDNGGQNMIEPASLGLPIISGPSCYNFTEITEILMVENALIRVANETELSDAVCGLFVDANRRHHLGEKAQNIIKANQGNIERLMALIKLGLE